LALIYRSGAASDLPAVFELNRQTLVEYWSYEGLQQAIKDGYDLMVCMDGTSLAGYLLSHDVIDEVHIMQIAVSPEYRRRGIAKQLSRKLIAAKQGMSLLLEVRASNHAAQSLYIKLGFSSYGLRKDYYAPRNHGEPREDAVLMQHQSD